MQKAEKDSLYSFSHKYKLVSKKDFQFVFDNPQKISLHAFTLLYRPNTLSHPRLGIVASKQKLKLAVARHTFKRIVRESFRLQKKSLKSLDIIVLMRSKCTPFRLPVDKFVVRQDMDTLWIKLAKV